MSGGPAWFGDALFASPDAVGDALEALQNAFREGLPTSPLRHHHELAEDRELLLMPAWDELGMGLKVVTLHPRGSALLDAWYVLMDPDGNAVAMVDGAALTAVRTAAVSAVATQALARADAATLVVFGAGAQARSHIRAMAAIRPIERVFIVARTEASGRALVAELREEDGGVHAEVGTLADLDRADIVCTCTTAGEPLFDGRLLAPGTHVNAVGAHRPDRRELDAHAVARARVVVETREAAFAEAGDLLIAEREGAWRREQVAANLSELLKGQTVRRSPEEVTLFKSVGIAAEDLVVARAALRRAG